MRNQSLGKHASPAKNPEETEELWGREEYYDDGREEYYDDTREEYYDDTREEYYDDGREEYYDDGMEEYYDGPAAASERELRRDRESRAASAKKPARRIGRGGRFLLVLLALFVFGGIAGLGTIRMMTHGPSAQMRIMFVRTLDDTTTLRKVPYLFLSAKEVKAALDTDKDSEEAVVVRYGMEKGAAQSSELTAASRQTYDQMIELSDISGGSWKGKMLKVHDPMLLILGTPNDTAAEGYGEFIQVEDYVAKYGAIAGTTAAGFRMSTNTPYGFVINHGELLFSESDKRYNVVAFNSDHIMTVKAMNAQEAIDGGYDIAVCWKPILIQDGVKRTGLGGGFNPRAAIGQTSDGTIVLVVIEGRMISSLGATLDELADFMEAQGCINAMNLDSGKSSIMYYNGEQLTKVAIGSGLKNEYRALPNAFLVLPEE